jgi:dTDP-4-amino-4,6-dideoxygalactose transaminase
VKVIEKDRNEFQKYLAANEIPSMIYYPVPLHLQKAYQNEAIGKGSFPITEKLSKTVISLPIHTEMKTEELEYICDTIKKF